MSSQHLLRLFGSRQLPTHAPSDIIAAIVNSARCPKAEGSAVVDQLRNRLLAFKPHQASQVLISCANAKRELPSDVLHDLRETICGGPSEMEPVQFVRSLEILQMMQGPQWDPISVPDNVIIQVINASSPASIVRLCRLGLVSGIRTRDHALSIVTPGSISAAHACELAFYLNQPDLLPMESTLHELPALVVPYSLAFCVAWNNESRLGSILNALVSSFRSLSSEQAQFALWLLLARGYTGSDAIVQQLFNISGHVPWNCIQTKHLCLSRLDDQYHVPYPIRVPTIGGVARKLTLVNTIQESFKAREKCEDVKANQIMQGKYFVDLMVKGKQSMILSMSEYDPVFRIHSKFLPPDILCVNAAGLNELSRIETFIDHIVS